MARPPVSERANIGGLNVLYRCLVQQPESCQQDQARQLGQSGEQDFREESGSSYRPLQQAGGQKRDFSPAVPRSPSIF